MRRDPLAVGARLDATLGVACVQLIHVVPASFRISPRTLSSVGEAHLERPMTPPSASSAPSLARKNRFCHRTPTISTTRALSASTCSGAAPLPLDTMALASPTRASRSLDGHPNGASASASEESRGENAPRDDAADAREAHGLVREEAGVRECGRGEDDEREVEGEREVEQALVERQRGRAQDERGREALQCERVSAVHVYGERVARTQVADRMKASPKARIPCSASRYWTFPSSMPNAVTLHESLY